jgi:adenylosuccinate lyase
MKLSEAIELLTSTYQSLDSVASGLPVDPKEINDALSKANPDSAEYVALQALAKFNPYENTKKEKVKQNDDTNQE